MCGKTNADAPVVSAVLAISATDQGSDANLVGFRCGGGAGVLYDDDPVTGGCGDADRAFDRCVVVIRSWLKGQFCGNCGQSAAFLQAASLFDNIQQGCVRVEVAEIRFDRGGNHCQSGFLGGIQQVADLLMVFLLTPWSWKNRVNAPSPETMSPR